MKYMMKTFQNKLKPYYGYFLNSIAIFSGRFSHIFAVKINFCCNLRSVTHNLKLNVSDVSPRISCNTETRVYGLVCILAYINAVWRDTVATYRLTKAAHSFFLEY